MGVNGGVSGGSGKAPMRCLGNVLFTLLVSILLGEPEIYNIDSLSLLSSQPDTEILWF